MNEPADLESAVDRTICRYTGELRSASLERRRYPLALQPALASSTWRRERQVTIYRLWSAGVSFADLRARSALQARGPGGRKKRGGCCRRSALAPPALRPGDAGWPLFTASALFLDIFQLDWSRCACAPRGPRALVIASPVTGGTPGTDRRAAERPASGKPGAAATAPRCAQGAATLENLLNCGRVDILTWSATVRQ
jgi:hypothetical protein